MRPSLFAAVVLLTASCSPAAPSASTLPAVTVGAPRVREQLESGVCSRLWKWPVSIAGTDTTRRYLAVVRVQSTDAGDDADLAHTVELLTMREGGSDIAYLQQVGTGAPGTGCRELMTGKDSTPRVVVVGLTRLY
jgi:hypothetical protein